MTISAPSDTKLARDMREHRVLFSALGVAMIVLGALSFVAAALYSVATVIVLGCLLVVGGVVQIVQALRGRQHGNAGMTVLAGICYLIAGVLLLVNPVVKALSLTMILSIFLVVAGIVRLVRAFSTKTFDNWGWWGVAGAVDIILGMLIWAQWPVSGLWVPGVFVGIDMIFEGIAWLAVANSNSRTIKAPGATP